MSGDTHPPAIASFTMDPDTLPSAGGSVTLTVKATDNVGVVKVAAPRAGEKAVQRTLAVLSQSLEKAFRFKLRE